MKSNLFILASGVVLSLCLVSFLYAQQKQVILTNGDLKQDYEILGIVTYSSGTPDIELVNEGLKKKASRMNADYVIYVRYISHISKIFGWGTAVKVKNPKF